MTKLTWNQVVRQNTGSHPMDSGGENGRHYQQPLPTKAITLSSYERDGKIVEVSGVLSLSHFLDATTKIDQKLTKWLRKESSTSLSEYAELLADHLGMKVVSKADNTYNHENDLSQNFQYILVGSGDDWHDDLDSCLAIICTHNGADIRGGYSDPVVCRISDKDDYHFFDITLSVCVAGVNNYEEGYFDEINETLEVGYSRCPTAELHKKVKSYKLVDDLGFMAELVTGELVEGNFYHRALPPFI